VDRQPGESPAAKTLTNATRLQLRAAHQETQEAQVGTLPHTTP
jgi:hypothetical protein